MNKNYHFIGIGGIGMSGMAHILLERNISVSGSDMAANTTIDSLQKKGAAISIGHDAKNILAGMTVVYSTDIKRGNPEFLAAKSLNCSMLHRSELLQMLMQSSHSLAVAGTHGKTTTSSLLAWVLEQSGLSPSYAIGGIVPQLQTNAKQGQGNFFVAEACESDGSFLNYNPYGAIVTNIDSDHLDFYGTEAELIKAFEKFISQVQSPEHLFWCGDDTNLKQLNLETTGISYGFGKDCMLRAFNFEQKEWMLSYDISYQGKLYPQVEVSLAGAHNALNALAVFGLALTLGIEETLIRTALSSFGGVLRRCEKKGESHKILFLDDYGHHPTEIRATLKAIRKAIGERRLVVAYQPHRYSRAKGLIGAYKNVFNDADHLFLTEIYAANEIPIPGVSHDAIMQEINNDSNLNCQHVARSHLASSLAAFLRPHDVCVSLGAGDITKLAGEVLAQYKLKAPQKLKVGVIMGGRSVEHEVSLMSSEHILNSLEPDLYEIEQFGITRRGIWMTGPQTRAELLNGKAADAPHKISSNVLDALMKSDILFPILHGSYGEDGTIQGFFEMLGLAYVGCDHRSAAVSMDKVLTKKLLIDAKIPTSPFIYFSRHTWNKDSNTIKEKIINQLKFPVFVKPTHLGSSVGVHKVDNVTCLDAAINDVFRFDTDALVENGIEGREIEFSVIGNQDVVAYPPGEILTGGEVYDYKGKYSKNGTKTSTQATLSSTLISEGIELVKKAYQVAGCHGMARIDTFLDLNGKFWLNEINPIPGFTQYSLFPQMCAVNGLEGSNLIDRLIILGLQRKRISDRLEVVPI
ncbi:MAG: UDP-N-acetylmuramate--L-alanine ligase [Parachlamydiaceae bacterium]|nr:UDP-N-acetylmuramate--L-alanine ligase [Parachlamydiaceae bacterium]